MTGSSGGAIVATLIAHNLNLDDFASDYIQARGKGLSLLKARLQEKTVIEGPSLSICTTKCTDGQLQIFDFPSTSSSSANRLWRALEASCHIPQSFHPIDLISPTKSYPDSEGIRVDTNEHYYYVDGGIAAPAPPITHPDLRRILISPIAGSGSNKHQDWRISPSATTASRLWPVTIGLKHDFRVDLSFTNLRALRAATGMTTSSELQMWYQRGQDDAQRFLDDKSLLCQPIHRTK